jgi:hypothetical protein
MSHMNHGKLTRKRTGSREACFAGDAERYCVDLSLAAVSKPGYTTRSRVAAAERFLAAKEPLPTADSRRSAPEESCDASEETR